MGIPTGTSKSRRDLLKVVGAGGAIVVLGAGYTLAGETENAQARAQKRPDGRPRLPPGQYLLQKLRDMGGQESDTQAKDFSLRIHGEVERPQTIDFRALLAYPQVTQKSDVHCVTKWSMLDAPWTGVRLIDIAANVGVKKTARHVILEAAHGYTANVTLAEALSPEVLVAHRFDGKPLPKAHGGPARALVPSLYFWKSAKWLTGIRFVARDEPGYWETRGYHNHADPWTEERYG